MLLRVLLCVMLCVVGLVSRVQASANLVLVPVVAAPRRLLHLLRLLLVLILPLSVLNYPPHLRIHIAAKGVGLL